jgi:hypothetical protein
MCTPLPSWHPELKEPWTIYNQILNIGHHPSKVYLLIILPFGNLFNNQDDDLQSQLHCRSTIYLLAQEVGHIIAK